MLTTYGDIKNDVIRKLGIATTSVNYSDAIIDGWIQQAHRWATSFKKWPHTEGRVSTTYASSTEEWLFEGYKAETFRRLEIDGKRLDKITFEDYKIFKEEDPTGNDRVFTDFGRLVVINPLVDLSGTLTAYGQYTPVDIDVTDLTATTVFSGRDEEANEAIVQEVLSYAKTRDQRSPEAQFYHKRAEAILDGLWARLGDEQYGYQTHRTRGGMFKRINVIDSGVEDDNINRDQFLF